MLYFISAFHIPSCQAYLCPTSAWRAGHYLLTLQSFVSLPRLPAIFPVTASTVVFHWILFFFFKWCLNSFNFTKIQTTVLYMFCISAYIWVDGKICFKRREWWFLFSQYSPSSSFVNAASKHLSTLSHISQSAKLTFWYSRKDCSSLLSFVAFPRCWPCWWVPSLRWVLLMVK